MEAMTKADAFLLPPLLLPFGVVLKEPVELGVGLVDVRVLDADEVPDHLSGGVSVLGDHVRDDPLHKVLELGSKPCECLSLCALVVSDTRRVYTRSTQSRDRRFKVYDLLSGEELERGVRGEDGPRNAAHVCHEGADVAGVEVIFREEMAASTTLL